MFVSRPLKFFNALEKIIYKIDKFFSGNWRLAVLDLSKGRWFVHTNPSTISYLKAENAKGRHILIQPSPDIEPFYLIADDLNRELLKKQHMEPDNSWKPGRMVVETSPDNYQVWIHSYRKISVDEKKYWLKKLKSDPSASPGGRWGRCPGFRNRKEKYQTSSGHFPLAKLIWVDWAKKAHIPAMKIEKEKHRPGKSISPVYRSAAFHSLCRSHYEKGNESVTDFSYALALARRGAPAEYIENQIRLERQVWLHHIGDKRINDYLKRTVKKAIEIIKNS